MSHQFDSDGSEEHDFLSARRLKPAAEARLESEGPAVEAVAEEWFDEMLRMARTLCSSSITRASRILRRAKERDVA